jgi:membrane glycosyltransferase
MDALRLVPAAPSPAGPYLPPEAPLAMPVQSLHESVRAGRLPILAGSMAARRAFVFGIALLLSIVAAYEMYQVLAVGGLTALEAVILILFVILFAWIALSFASLLGGVIARVTGYITPLEIGAGALPPIASRTALLFPTYNEEPDRLLARVQAICESVGATGMADRFDVFVLSDTTDPDIFIAEESAFLALRERVAAACERAGSS